MNDTICVRFVPFRITRPVRASLTFFAFQTGIEWESGPTMRRGTATTVTTADPSKASDKADRVQAARRLLAEGKSKRAVAAELGVAESTLRRWLKS